MTLSRYSVVKLALINVTAGSAVTVIVSELELKVLVESLQPVNFVRVPGYGYMESSMKILCLLPAGHRKDWALRYGSPSTKKRIPVGSV